MRDPVLVMQPHVFRDGHHFQVLQSVVGAIRVLVMYHFSAIHPTAEMLFHQMDMFQFPPAVDSDLDIPVWPDRAAAFPVRIYWTLPGLIETRFPAGP